MKAFMIFSSLVFVSAAQFGSPQYGDLGRFTRGNFGFGNGGGGGGGGRGFVGGSSGGGGYGGQLGGSSQGGSFGGSFSGGHSGGGTFGGSGGGYSGGQSEGGFRPSQQFGGGHQDRGADFQEEPRAKIHKYVSIHVAPQEQPSQRSSRPIQPKERETHYQIVFIKAPHSSPGESGEIQLPPPPQTKTLVYVLLKKPELGDILRYQRPSSVRPSKPEVYFIRYKGGDKNKNGESIGGDEGGKGGGNGDFGPGSGPEGPGGSSGPSGEEQKYGPPGSF